MMSWVTLYANRKYDPYMVIKVLRFLGYFLSMNEAEITDTLNTNNEMPRISAAIWDINRVVFDRILRCKW